MKRLTMLLLSSFFIMGLSGTVIAQDITTGKAEYQENCAACHGKKGKGDGSVAKVLKADVPGLTMLSKNNGGVFPFERVYQTIDGRDDIEAHGPRDMPIWGKEYIAETEKTYGPNLIGGYSEDIARARILALIDYINSLQVK